MTRPKIPDQSSLIKLSDHYKNNKYKDAEKLATSLTKEFPTHSYSWKVLGAIFGLTNRHSDSLNAFETVVKLEPNDPMHFLIKYCFAGSDGSTRVKDL